MRNLLFDLSAIKTGGGAQRALNFINVLNSVDITTYNVFILKPKGYFEDITKSSSIKKIIHTPSNFILRYIYENTILKYIIKNHNIQTVMTFAGTGIPLPNNVKSLVGVAYPIICYNDSPYWKYIKKSKYIKQRVKNYFRIRRLKKATMLFVQTSIMQSRLSLTLNRPQNKIYICPPSPSSFLMESSNTNDNKILLLSGNDSHKNLWRLYDVAKRLKSNNVSCKFILSVTKSNWLQSLSLKKIDFTLIDEYFIFYGPVSSDKIQFLYDESKFLLQLSDLESFSNNYMEAWKARIPLIVSDRDFAREICKSSALYVDPHNTQDVADKIHLLLNNINLQNTLIQNGDNILRKLPTQEQYYENIMKMLYELEEKY